MIFVPASGPNVVDGVFELTVNEDMAGLDLIEAASVVRREFNLLNEQHGIEFEAYSMIMPSGVSGRGGTSRV